MDILHVIISSIVLVTSLAVFIVSTNKLRKKVKEVYEHPEHYIVQ